MTKEKFVAELERALVVLGELPVTAALLSHLACALKKGEPDWWLRAERAWQDRRFVAWTEAWSLFLAAVHADVLGDPDSPLRRYFPSCGGTSEVDPTGVFARYLSGLPRQFYSRLRQARRQGFSASRAALWLPPAASFFARRGLPFYLVELDAGSGLNLAADLGGPKSFDSSLIAARVGLDPEPLELREPETKLWLAAGSPPEAVEELSRLKAAVEAASRRMDEEAAFIQLARCPLIKAPAFLRRNIPVDDPDVGLLVFNIAASGRLDEAEYARFRCEMAATLSPWGERGLWLEVELLRGQPFATTVQATLRRPSPGGLLELAAVQFDAVADRVSYDAARADRFLA